MSKSTWQLFFIFLQKTNHRLCTITVKELQVSSFQTLVLVWQDVTLNCIFEIGGKASVWLLKFDKECLVINHTPSPMFYYDITFLVWCQHFYFMVWMKDQSDLECFTIKIKRVIWLDNLHTLKCYWVSSYRLGCLWVHTSVVSNNPGFTDCDCTWMTHSPSTSLLRPNYNCEKTCLQWTGWSARTR